MDQVIIERGTLLRHVMQRRIVELLAEHAPQSTSELTEALRASDDLRIGGNLRWYHLDVLAKAGIIAEVEHAGKGRVLTLNRQRLAEVASWMQEALVDFDCLLLLAPPSLCASKPFNPDNWPRLLVSQNRRSLLFALADDTNATVERLITATSLTQSNMSGHLAQLMLLGVVAYEQHGKTREYRIDRAVLQAMRDQLKKFLEIFPVEQQKENYDHKENYY